MERFEWHMMSGLCKQQEIVHRVESLFAKADAIAQRYESVKAMLDQLPQAILAKAFRGELVAQNPEDGDASLLLEEIRKMRAELRKGAKVGKRAVEG